MLPFFNQARARQRATAQTVAFTHQAYPSPPSLLLLPFSASLDQPFCSQAQALNSIKCAYTSPPAHYPPPLLLFSCDTRRLSANFAFLNWFLLPSPSLLLPLSLSLSHSLALYLSLDAHFCLSARINFNGPHTPSPLKTFPLHIFYSFLLSTPFPFPVPFLLVLSLVIRNPSVFGQLCACARIRNERWRVRVRGPPSTSPSRLSSHYAYAALRRTYTCCRS